MQKGWRRLSSFGNRLTTSFAAQGRLCVGIDPHSWLLSEWNLADSAVGAREFGLRVVEAAAGRVSLVKPQVAFFERFGSAGYRALEDVLAAARAVGLVVIADVKRGDVGSSVEAYAEAWLTPGSPLEVDAMTVSAFQGVGSLKAPFELAEKHGKGVFVLAVTSNPEAAALQQATTSAGSTVAATISADVVAWNAANAANNLGSVGLVIGATIATDDYRIDMSELRNTPILAPGFGYQGARFDQLGERYGVAAGSVIVSVSRSILSAGPAGIAAAISSQVAEVAGCHA